MLKIEGLSRTYKTGQTVLNNINLNFPEGSFTIIAGSNGSGKTQLMRHLNGLLKAQKGKILLDGKNINDDLNSVRRQIGLVFQNADSQIVGQTVARDIAFGAENLKWPRKLINEKLQKLLNDLKLTELRDRRPHTLSGGEKRRSVLASVLIMDPGIIVLDEPFTGLDYQGVKDVLRDITTLHKKGKTIILISHDLEKCLAHADRLVILDKGEVKADSPPAALLDQLDQYGIRKPWGENRSLKSMTWLDE